MVLRLYNTLTRQKAAFEPIDPNNVRMYVCGPTVYDFAHIGNARPVIVFDVLFRLLRHIYGDSHVTYVRNITDVDDKINARALRDFPGLPLNEAIARVTEKTANQFHADVAALGCLEPTHEPRATDNIQEMTDIIQELLDRQNAYVANGKEGREVLFDIASMPDYGQLSQRKLDEQKAGARVEVEAHKKNPGDFVLWKESDDQTPGWHAEFRLVSVYPANSEILTIRGRPGWHIECSAMSRRYLGKVFDIHGGGLDLIFPHHENEIAQSRCAHGTPVMANVWMHNGFLQVEGEKMSKSLGNFVTINELLETSRFGGQRWPGEVLRLAMLKTPYREPIDWTVMSLQEGISILQRWGDTASPSANDPPEEFIDALCDDLDTQEAVQLMHRMRENGQNEQLGASLRFLGLPIWKPISGSTSISFKATGTLSALVTNFRGEQVSVTDIEKLTNARLEARKRKDFRESDRIRDELAQMGIVLKDTKNKETGEIETTWEVAR